MHDITQLISSKFDLEKLNACKLHLQVMFLSDMTNNQGNRLIKEILSGDINM